jgi:hypothetical protein
MRFPFASSGLATSFLATATLLSSTVFAQSNTTTGLSVKLSIASKVLNGSTDGHVTVLFAPAGVDPMNDTDVTSSPNVSSGPSHFPIGKSCIASDLGPRLTVNSSTSSASTSSVLLPPRP